MNYRKRLPWPRVKAELISKMTLMSPKILSDVYLSMFSFTPQNMTIHARGRDRLFFYHFSKHKFVCHRAQHKFINT